MIDLLFVYGTLRRGCDNDWARKLHAQSDFVGTARVRGQVYRTGAYTGLVDDVDGWVSGEVFRLREPEPLFAELDDYEGSDYERVVRDADLADSAVVRVHLYRYRHPVSGQTPV